MRLGKAPNRHTGTAKNFPEMRPKLYLTSLLMSDPPSMLREEEDE